MNTIGYPDAMKIFKLNVSAHSDRWITLLCAIAADINKQAETARNNFFIITFFWW